MVEHHFDDEDECCWVLERDVPLEQTHDVLPERGGKFCKWV
jgi:hypothetical protein